MQRIYRWKSILGRQSRRQFSVKPLLICTPSVRPWRSLSVAKPTQAVTLPKTFIKTPAFIFRLFLPAQSAKRVKLALSDCSSRASELHFYFKENQEEGRKTLTLVISLKSIETCSKAFLFTGSSRLCYLLRSRHRFFTATSHQHGTKSHSIKFKRC